MSTTSCGSYEDAVLCAKSAHFLAAVTPSAPEVVITDAALAKLPDLDTSMFSNLLASVCGEEAVLSKLIIAGRDEVAHESTMLGGSRPDATHIYNTKSLGYVFIVDENTTREQISYDAVQVFFVGLIRECQYYTRLIELASVLTGDTEFDTAARQLDCAAHLSQLFFTQGMILPSGEDVWLGICVAIMEAAIADKKASKNLSQLTSMTSVADQLIKLRTFMVDRIKAGDKDIAVRTLAYVGHKSDWTSLAEDITEIKLSGELITWKDLDFLECLAALEHLDLSHTAVGSKDSEVLIHLTELKSLSLEGTYATNSVVENASSLFKLNKLNISNTRVSDKVLAALTYLPLKTLDIRGTRCTRDGISKLTEHLIDCEIIHT